MLPAHPAVFRCLVNNVGSLSNGCAAEVARGAYTGLTFWSFVSAAHHLLLPVLVICLAGAGCLGTVILQMCMTNRCCLPRAPACLHNLPPCSAQHVRE